MPAAGVGAGDKVAIDLLNRPEYLETFYAALRLGAVPVNVNYRYGVEETRYLLDDADAAAVVTEDRFAPVVTDAVARLDVAAARPHARRRATTPRSAATPTAPRHEPGGDDLVFLYTGGTTGMPKGVMWRIDDLYAALWQMGRPGTEPPDPLVAVRAGKRAATTLPACPLMHGTGLFVTLSALSGGGTVVLIDEMGLDPVRIWDEVDAREVAVLTIVGDAFARPLLDALDAEPDRWSLASLRAITSSGVTWSPEVKRGLLDHLPGRHPARLARRVGGADVALGRPRRRRRHPARPVRGQRPRAGAHRRRPRGRARERRDRHGRRRRAHPARVLQGSREDRDRRSGPSAASATRSRATTRPSTPTARSGSSGGARPP